MNPRLAQPKKTQRFLPVPAPVIAAAVAVLLAAPAASAQSQQPVNPAQPGQTTKSDGAAEQAPKRPDLFPSVNVLPPVRDKSKAFQLFELDGYMRFRGDWFKQFDLGFSDDPAAGGSPFPNPLACKPTAGVAKPCEDATKAGNIRLRLEPTIHINEKTRVKLQVDVLDNVVLGSTPDGLFLNGSATGNPSLSAFADGQVAPEAGRNSLTDSIVVKRAWGEVDTSFGEISFGRQPAHWGLGIMANAGGYDKIHDSYDLDADYGDNVDRLMFEARIPGTNLDAAIAMDWSQVAPTSAQTDLYLNRYRGQAFDLDDNDDVNQWVFVIKRMDRPAVFDDKVEQDELALNYGAYFTYRTQSFDSIGAVLGETPNPDNFVRRDLTAYIPDVWVRLAYKKFWFEFEGVGVLGSMDQQRTDGRDEGVDLRQLGLVGRTGYGFVGGDLRLEMEIGFASGDQHDNDPQGSTHISDAVVLADSDPTMSAFFFDQDYKIDLILFREMYGAVTNALYFRPSIEYDITNEFRIRGQSVWSYAHKPIATPGNSSGLGVEVDLDVGYNDVERGFYAGIAYGVLFPLAGLDHPIDFPNQGGPGFEFGGNAGDAQTAQTIQLRMMLKF